MEESDPRKFSLATPKQISLAYTRLWDPDHGPDAGAVPSKHIIHDVKKVFESMEIVRQHKGACCEVGSRKGERARLVQESLTKEGYSNNWGGNRTKNPYEIESKFWWHPDVGGLDNDFEEYCEALVALSKDYIHPPLEDVSLSESERETDDEVDGDEGDEARNDGIANE